MGPTLRIKLCPRSIRKILQFNTLIHDRNYFVLDCDVPMYTIFCRIFNKLGILLWVSMVGLDRNLCLFYIRDFDIAMDRMTRVIIFLMEF